MTTFNITWIGEFFAADPVRHDQELGCWHKFKCAYDTALDTGVDSFAGYIQLVRSRPGSDAEFRKGDKTNLLSMYKWLQDEKGYAYIFSDDELEHPDPAKRTGAVLDEHTPEQVDDLIRSIQYPMVGNLLTFAECGIPMAWVEHVESVTGNILHLTTGDKVRITDEESALLTRALSESASRKEYMSRLKKERIAPVDRFARVRNAVSIVRKDEMFPYTYGDLEDKWELEGFLEQGISFANTVSNRYGIDVETIKGHPMVWLEDERISEDTYNTIVNK